MRGFNLLLLAGKLAVADGYPYRMARRDISREDLLSKSRKRQIVQARQISMYLSRNLISNCSLATIGAETGGKDHATVLHACSTVSDLMSTDKTFKQYVSDIERILVPEEH